MIVVIKLDNMHNYAIIQISMFNLFFDCIINDTDLLITWSSNPQWRWYNSWKAKKSGLIGMWHNENLSQGTNIVGIRNPYSTKTNFQMRSIIRTICVLPSCKKNSMFLFCFIYGYLIYSNRNYIGVLHHWYME